MSDQGNIIGLFNGPFWSSAFRPFYLLGVLYGLLIMTGWLLFQSGSVVLPVPNMSLSLWHGHEMIFGFSGAIVLGFVLTALPGWAGTAEITGKRLALLVVLWLGGRLAFQAGAMIPPMITLILDSSLYLVAALMVLPGLCAISNKHYLAVILIFLMMAGGNIVFYEGLFEGDHGTASYGIKIGVLAIIVKFILAGGFLATTFTNNALKQKGLPGLAVRPALEYISAFTLLLFICAVLLKFEGAVTAVLALLIAVVQIIRILRWRTGQIWDAPLVMTMHLAYLWFILAMVIYAVESLNGGGSPHIWLHAFTVGALSLMMLSLITRVALRHTGRSLRPARAMIFSFGVMVAAALLRLLLSLNILDQSWLSEVAGLWALSFIIYIILHGLFLIRPSLPKQPRTSKRAKEVS